MVILRPNRWSHKLVAQARGSGEGSTEPVSSTRVGVKEGWVNPQQLPHSPCTPLSVTVKRASAPLHRTSGTYIAWPSVGSAWNRPGTSARRS